MKKTKKCTKCESTEIFYLESVVDRAHGNNASKLLVGLKNDFWRGKIGGEIEAYICANCGYVEFYLKDPKSLYDSDVAVNVKP
ncbi:hypothetical protein JW887_00470 [Candidatus Dojkabacteria bacterium]|nr:hypothetical protein [Candidatus Dojkabacteria bacterium]